METDLAKLIPKKFVQRKDVKAQQTSDGAYHPVNESWSMSDFRQHLSGEKTFGHYLSDTSSEVKLFAFDVDLEKSGTWVERGNLLALPDGALVGPDSDAWLDATTVIHESNPRQDWLDRRNPGRNWYKLGLRTLGEMISSAIHKELEIPVLCAYSGNKGIHVYGFTGVVGAHEARTGALMALEYAANSFSVDGEFVPTKGNNFYKYNSDNKELGLNNMSIELFPKQDSMEGKSYGNLMRLPLGKNLKNPGDPTFFVDQRLPHTQLAPHPDPVALLNGKSPWED